MLVQEEESSFVLLQNRRRAGVRHGAYHTCGTSTLNAPPIAHHEDKAVYQPLTTPATALAFLRSGTVQIMDLLFRM